MRNNLEREITEIVGEKACAAILDKFAGRRLYVPAKPNDFLIGLIGESEAEKLCYSFKSVRIDLPANRIKIDRNQKILSDRQSMTISQLCEKYKMSRSQVLRILKKHKQI